MSPPNKDSPCYSDETTEADYRKNISFFSRHFRGHVLQEVDDSLCCPAMYSSCSVVILLKQTIAKKNISFCSGLFLRVHVLQEVDDLPLLSGYRFFMICDETSEADYCKKNISFFSGLFLRGHVLQEVDGHPFVVPTIDSCSSDDTSEADYRIILGFCTLPTIEQHNQQKLGMPFKNNNLRVSLVV